MKTLYLISLYGLSQIIDVPRHTVKKWIDEYEIYIPKAKINDVTYFELEAIDVLKFIKIYTEQKLEKIKIENMLANTTFVLTENL
ncbi:MerR family transcriptional regulator [Oceanobacillus sp. CF4.6]|uniref:MerR family transcriptional regulator n=1 Tax=Oceanobacillus sp. CF4.6 TaxID=3373080 RepID=UPI003EE43568